MQFERRLTTVRSRYTVSGANDRATDSGVFQHNLQFYLTAPTDTIALLEFESLAIHRLKVLQEVASLGERLKKGTSEYETELGRALKQLKFNIAVTATKLQAQSAVSNRYPQTDEQRQTEEKLVTERRNDHLSHFILRLAFCRSPELQKWFLQQELDLFRFRFRLEGSASKEKFLRLNGLQMEKVDEAQVRQLLPQLKAVTFMGANKLTSESTFWKVPWKQALDLVKSRKVHLSDGVAFVPDSDAVVAVAAKFRGNLSRSLTRASKYFGYIQEEERLMPLLKRLTNKAYMGKDYTNTHTDPHQITPEMLDTLSNTSFPPCMRQLHSRLRRDHHLKHWGRMQYGLFLKGIGLSMDDAMRFWRQEFTKIVDVDKFDKQYSYNIRHNYGKEGKRADYSPYHCTKIIMSNPPGSQDAHGCPFKHSDPAVLKQKLEAMQLTSDRVTKITNLSKAGFYDQACTRFFEATHRIPEEALGYLIGHPNQFFEESRKVLAGERKFTTETTVAPPSESAGKTDNEDDDMIMAAVQEFEDSLPLPGGVGSDSQSDGSQSQTTATS